MLKNKNQHLKGQIDRIQHKEKRRLESLQKYQNKEKAMQKMLNKEHKQLIQKMKDREELRRQKGNRFWSTALRT